MLALIAGAGRLPEVLAQGLRARDERFVTVNVVPEGQGDYHLTLDTLGETLNALKAAGVTRLCLAGSLDRRTLTIHAPGPETQKLLPTLKEALSQGDDGALRAVMGLFVAQGFEIVSAHDLLPELMPGAGVLTNGQPGEGDRADATRAAQVHTLISAADIGQSLIVEAGQILGVEALPGTDHMIRSVADHRSGRAKGGIFFKAAKQGQSMQADVPTIGPETVSAVAAAGLNGLVLTAGQVMVLDRDQVIEEAEKAGLFLWLREAEA